MLSKQKFFTVWLHSRSHSKEAVWKFIQPYLRGKFDEETTQGIIEIHFKTLEKLLRGHQGATVDDIKRSMLAALRTIHLGKALHNGDHV